MAVTDAFAPSVKVQVRVLLPPLEQAPDQIASRPFVTVKVTEPVGNEADPVVPTLTLMPAGFDVTRSPLRPVAVTVSVAVVVLPCGATVSVAVREAPPYEAVMVADVLAATLVVVTANVALVVPAATVTLDGTPAAALLLETATAAPPVGAAADNVTVPLEPFPPTTLVGFTVRPDRVAGPAVVCVVKLRVEDQEPAVPAAFRPRTRHHTR